MRKLAVVVVGLGLLIGCGQENPCDDYVDYMCACHDGEDGVDCDELTTTYANADARVQDECAIALDEQQAADADAGLECDF